MALGPWMLYGANGYAGKIIAEEAKRRGIAPILAGRDPRQLPQLGAQLQMQTRVFDLADSSRVTQALAGIAAVLNCAGPFSATARPMLDACLRTGTHYLDITGEIAVFESVHARADEVRRAGIVALPGVGFDVVPSDCLAAMLKRALPDAMHLCLAFTSLGRVGPGTARTMVEGLALGTKLRRDGVIVTAPTTVRVIPFANKPSQVMAIPWGDVATAYYSTGIPNIVVYMEVRRVEAMLLRLSLLAPIRRLVGAPASQSLLKWLARRIVKGPSTAERARGAQLLWGEVSNAAGRRVTMRLRTPEPYAFTAAAALSSVVRLLAGGLTPGVHTPSRAFGEEFVLQLPGVSRLNGR